MRELAGQEAVEDHSQAVDIAAGVGFVESTGRLLGRHVRRCTGGLTSHRYRSARVGLLERLCQTKVQHVRMSVFGHQDIRRLKIAMDHATLVGVLDGAGDSGHQAQNFALRKASLIDVVIKVNAVNQLHRVVIHAAMQATVIDAGNVRMLQPSSQFHFPLETRASRVRSKGPAAHNLQRHFALSTELHGPPDRSHASPPQRTDYAIAFNLRRRTIRNWRPAPPSPLTIGTWISSG